jgi:hypothetical protein
MRQSWWYSIRIIKYTIAPVILSNANDPGTENLDSSFLRMTRQNIDPSFSLHLSIEILEDMYKSISDRSIASNSPSDPYTKNG